jgi:hypothetical protein
MRGSPVVRCDQGTLISTSIRRTLHTVCNCHRRRPDITFLAHDPTLKRLALAISLSEVTAAPLIRIEAQFATSAAT